MHKVIEDIAELESLRPEWSDLWRRCTRSTPFQSPEWLLAWWRHIFQGGRLWTIAIRDQGRLVGLLPFYRWGDRLQNLSFIGTGITDYNDVLLAEGVPLPPIQGDWESAQFEELREGSPLLGVGVPERCSVCPVISLPAHHLDPKLRPGSAPLFKSPASRWKGFDRAHRTIPRTFLRSTAPAGTSAAKPGCSPAISCRPSTLK